MTHELFFPQNPIFGEYKIHNGGFSDASYKFFTYLKLNFSKCKYNHKDFLKFS